MEHTGLDKTPWLSPSPHCTGKGKRKNCKNKSWYMTSKKEHLPCIRGLTYIGTHRHHESIHKGCTKLQHCQGEMDQALLPIWEGICNCYLWVKEKSVSFKGLSLGISTILQGRPQAPNKLHFSLCIFVLFGYVVSYCFLFALNFFMVWKRQRAAERRWDMNLGG